MTLRVYTDVTGMRPRTRLGALLGDSDWAEMGRNADLASGKEDEAASPDKPEPRSNPGTSKDGSDGAGVLEGHRIKIRG